MSLICLNSLKVIIVVISQKFSWFGIDGRIEPADGIGLVCGVFIGTYIWWGTLSGVVTLLKKKAGNSHLSAMNRIFGTILILFGAVVLVRSFLH